jgi:putative methyltransferase (TIGR04325 family)
MRQLLKGLLPPFLLGLVRVRSRKNATRTIWDGIFSHLRDVPAQNSAYDDSARVREMVNEASEWLTQVKNGRLPRHWHGTLSVLTAVANRILGKVTIVDFGGGLGSGFIQILARAPTVNVEYHVVDLPRMCMAGKQFYGAEPRIQFHTALDEVKVSPDIVYASGVLQYIDDYAGQLSSLVGNGPAWFLLARTPIVDVPTFATRQLNLSGQIIPYWFFNRLEIIGVLRNLSYELIFENFTGVDYDQSNFPETHRIGRMRNMLFAREANTLAAVRRDRVTL